MIFERTYCLKRAVSVADLADFLTKVTWRLCTAFRLDGRDDTLFLNDSKSIVDRQEYAVLRRIEGTWYQVESIKCGWIISHRRAAELITEAISGGYDSQKGTPQTLHFHEFDQPCALCQAR